MLPEIGSALIGAGSSLFGSLFGNTMSRSNMRLSNRLNKDFFDYTFGKQAAYNSPLAQVGRLKAAGLNPALAAAGGVGNTIEGSTSSVPSPSASSPDLVNGAREGALLSAQISNVRADTANKVQDTILKNKQSYKTEAETLGQKIENSIKEIDLYKNDKTKDTYVAQVQQDLVNSQFKLKVLQSQERANDAAAAMNLSESEYKQFMTDNVLPAQVRNIDQDTWLKYQQAETELTKRANLEALSAMYGAMSEMYSTQADVNRAMDWQIHQLTPYQQKQIDNQIKTGWSTQWRNYNEPKLQNSAAKYSADKHYEGVVEGATIGAASSFGGTAFGDYLKDRRDRNIKKSRRPVGFGRK